MEDKKLSAGESELEVRGLQWLDTGHYRKKPPQFGYNPHDWNELCLVADAQRQIAEHKRLLAERDARIEALTEYAAAVERSADKAEQELDQLRARATELRQAFHRLDLNNPEPLDKFVHCCEHAIHGERERLHALLDSAKPSDGIGEEP